MFGRCYNNSMRVPCCNDGIIVGEIPHVPSVGVECKLCIDSAYGYTDDGEGYKCDNVKVVIINYNCEKV